MAKAMTEAGYGCDESREELADSHLSRVFELETQMTCMWPTEQKPDLPPEEVWVTVFQTEMGRLKFAHNMIAWACGTGQGGLAYTYGDRWSVLHDDIGNDDLPLEAGLPDMEALAEDLGGAAHGFDCSDYAALERWDSLDLESPTLSIEDLKRAVGEPTST